MLFSASTIMAYALCMHCEFTCNFVFFYKWKFPIVFFGNISFESFLFLLFLGFFPLFHNQKERTSERETCLPLKSPTLARFCFCFCVPSFSHQPLLHPPTFSLLSSCSRWTIELNCFENLMAFASLIFYRRTVITISFKRPKCLNFIIR